MTDIILIVGGGGFLGQHLIKELQERDHSVKEIRVLDIISHKNKLLYSERVPVKSISGDICSLTRDVIKVAFENVDVVFHCASVFTIEYPPSYDEMEKVNVEGTQKVIELCIEFNIEYLIYTSDIVVSMVPLTPSAVIAAIVNQTESKAQFPSTDSGYIIPGYSSTKLKGEKLILNSHGRVLSNGRKSLVTTALRVALIYGEEDKIFTNIISFAYKYGGKIPRFAADGGKHQLIYAGNAAWAHICAKNSLKKDANAVGGLPVNITDDTPPYDLCRLLNIITARYSNNVKVKLSSWKIPLLLGYLLAVLWIFALNIINRFKLVKIKYDPIVVIKYWGSLCYWSRMRATLHMEYEPIYNADEAMKKSGIWYDQWYKEKYSKTK